MKKKLTRHEDVAGVPREAFQPDDVCAPLPKDGLRSTDAALFLVRRDEGL